MASSKMISTATSLLREIVEFSEREDQQQWQGQILVNPSSKSFVTITARVRALAQLINTKEGYCHLSWEEIDHEAEYVKQTLRELNKCGIIRLKTTSSHSKPNWTITLNFNSTDVESEIQQLSQKLKRQLSTKSLQTPQQYLDLQVYDAQHWVDRGHLTNTLLGGLRSQQRLLVLVGLSGIGKTAQAERLITRLREDRSWTEVRRNCDVEDDTSFKGFAVACLAKAQAPVTGNSLNLDRGAPEALMEPLIQQLTQQPHLILLDSAEYLLTNSNTHRWGDFRDPLWGKFLRRFLAAESCASRLIITCQSEISALNSLRERYHLLWQHHLLSGWIESEQIDFYNSYKNQLTLGQLNNQSDHPLLVIGRVYDGHPLVLKVVCGEIIGSYGGDIDHYWQCNHSYVTTVEQELLIAQQRGASQFPEDDWRLHNYTQVLADAIQGYLAKSLDRLRQDSDLAYHLLCLASLYRIAVPDHFWLQELAIRGLETELFHRQALILLQNRYLINIQSVRVERPSGQGPPAVQAETHVSMHNLIRSLAIPRRLELFPQ
jgi:AAA domain